MCKEIDRVAFFLNFASSLKLFTMSILNFLCSEKLGSTSRNSIYKCIFYISNKHGFECDFLNLVNKIRGNVCFLFRFGQYFTKKKKTVRLFIFFRIFV